MESRISNATVRNIVLQLKLSLSIESLKKYLFAFIVSMNNQDNESGKIETYFFKDERSDLELELKTKINLKGLFESYYLVVG